MPIRDLLVSRRGVWNWATSTSALPADEIDRTAQALRRFFRDGIPELDEVVSRARPEVSLDGYDVLLEASTRGRSADEVCSVVFSSDLPEAVEARLCLRDATLGLEPFLPAATRGTRIASLGTRERGYEALAAMPTDAVFDEENRVGMPEEVLAYSTAGSLDRDLFALLLGDAGNR
jgi:hypothetical protein